MMFLIIFTVILMIFYLLLGTAEIPINRIMQSPSWVVSANDPPVSAYPNHFPNFVGNFPEENCPEAVILNTSDPASVSGACIADSYTWSVAVTFPVYVIAWLSFVGWFFFMVFAGVGLIALPMDMINAFRTRPKPIPWKEFDVQHEELADRCTKLRVLGEAIRKLQRETKPENLTKKEALKQRNYEMNFQRAFHLLKADINVHRQLKNLNDVNPFIPLCKLLFGVFSLIISLFWIVHIFVFVLQDPYLHPFLNDLFIELENIENFPFFGVTAYAMFAFHLMWCTVVGNYKVGMRCFCVNLFPMEPGDTPLNGFLANCWILIICSVPAVQFCSTAFPLYARETYVNMLFGTQVQYMQFISVFWENNIFVFAMLMFALFTLIQSIMCPKNNAATHTEELQKLFAERDEIAKE
jgi:LMBR1 domain-containing protein 1